MSRRSLLSISAIMMLGLTALPNSAISQQWSIKDQLVGTWTLASWEHPSRMAAKTNRMAPTLAPIGGSRDIEQFGRRAMALSVGWRSERPNRALIPPAPERGRDHAENGLPHGLGAASLRS